MAATKKTGMKRAGKMGGSTVKKTGRKKRMGGSTVKKTGMKRAGKMGGSTVKKTGMKKAMRGGGMARKR